jgi:hypothetical protein
MRKQLNKLLVKFGLLLTKAPTILAANLTGISFYDSIVVFDKKKRALPKSEFH